MKKREIRKPVSIRLADSERKSAEKWGKKFGYKAGHFIRECLNEKVGLLEGNKID
jgi:hypothetical protein